MKRFPPRRVTPQGLTRAVNTETSRSGPRRPLNAVRSGMKARWVAEQRLRLVAAHAQLHALVGHPNTFPTHAAYMIAVNAAVAAKRQAERESALAASAGAV